MVAFCHNFYHILKLLLNHVLLTKRSSAGMEKARHPPGWIWFSRVLFSFLDFLFELCDQRIQCHRFRLVCCAVSHRHCTFGNLFFAWANKAFTAPEKQSFCDALAGCIEEVFDLTREKLSRRYDELVTLPLYRVPAFRQNWLDNVMDARLEYLDTKDKYDLYRKWLSEKE